MASIHNDIRAALETELYNVPNLPLDVDGLPNIAYENVSFSPITDESYLQIRYIPTLRRPAVRGLNPQQRYDGVFQVICYTPEGSGPAAADALANIVIDAFEATTKIEYTNPDDITITVSIDYAERQQGFLDNPWYYVPINIGWYCYN